MTGVQTCALPICFPVTIPKETISEYADKVETAIGDLVDQVKEKTSAATEKAAEDVTEKAEEVKKDVDDTTK